MTPAQSSRRQTRLIYGAVWAAFLALSVFFCAALLRDSQDSIIGKDYIGGLSHWALWWPQQAVVHNYELAYNSYSLFPLETNLLPLLSLPTSLVYGLLRLPLGPGSAFHSVLPVYLTLNAGLGFLLYRKYLDHPRLAMVGGGVLAFNPLTFQLAARGEFALLGFFALLAWMLLWDAFMERLTFWHWMACVVGLYLVVLMSLQFWNVILTLLLPYAVFRARKRRNEKIFVDYMLLGGLVMAILFFLYPMPQLLASTYSERYAPFEVWQGVVSLNTLEWKVVAALGVMGLVAAMLVPWRVTPHRNWWVGIVGVNLLLYWQPSLAPLSLLGGLGQVPNLPHLTQPAVFLIPAIMASTLLSLKVAAYVVEKLTHPLARRGLLVLLVIVPLAISDWWGELPTSPLPHSDLVRAMADDPENYIIIDYPIGADSLATRASDEAPAASDEVPDDLETTSDGQFGFADSAGRALAYVPIHHKRVVGGLTSTLLEDDLRYYQESPLIRMLTFQEQAASQELVPLIRNEVTRLRVGYINLHDSPIPPEFTTSLRGWLNWTGSFCQVAAGEAIEIWRARWHPAGCPPYAIQLGGADGELAVGAGWYPAEFWATGPVRWAGPTLTSTLTLWATPAHDYDLHLRAMSPDIPDQSVEIIVAGDSLGIITLEEGWAEHTVTIPREAFQQGGLLQLELRHSQTAAVEGRQLAAVYDFVRLEPTGQDGEREE